MSSPERIGILGGSFDPVHIGHLVAATTVRHACKLDRVLLMVANEPWQKTSLRPVTDAEFRYAAVAAAVADTDGLEASHIEIDRGGQSYTVETLETIRAGNPMAEVFLICGTDAASLLHTWVRSDEVARLAGVVVVDRPGAAFPNLGTQWQTTHVLMPALDVSSSDLRRRLAEGEPADFLIPQPVLNMIATRGLYARDQESKS